VPPVILSLGERPFHEHFKVTFKGVHEGHVASAHAIDADHRYPVSIIPGGHRMVMEKIEQVQEYTAMITQEILDHYDGVVRVWDTPRSAIDGGQVVHKISQPTEIVVSAEEKDLYGSLPQRAKICYGDGKEGWVLYQMIAKMGEERRS
jgi:hypothetical protein